jgi:anti-anti-sigma factor
MEEPSGILAGEMNGTIFVRVEGRATHLNSHLLKQFVSSSIEQKRGPYQIDLSKCTYMDSTFLGMMAGIASRAMGHSLPPIKLVNPTERVRGMLENLGIIHLFEIVQGPTDPAVVKKIEGKAVSAEEKTRDMLEAHQTLVSISKDNEVKFRDVIALLQEKMQNPGPQ